MIKVVKMMIIMCFLSQQSCSVVISFYPCLILTIVHHVLLHFQSVSQFSHSRVRLFAIPWTVALQASLSITTSCSLLKLKSIELVMSSNHLILCRPLLLLPSVFPSLRVFSSESVVRIRQPKYWRFSFSISPSNQYSGLISFGMDWLDLLAVQGTLKILNCLDNEKTS